MDVRREMGGLALGTERNGEDTMPQVFHRWSYNYYTGLKNIVMVRSKLKFQAKCSGALHMQVLLFQPCLAIMLLGKQIT